MSKINIYIFQTSSNVNIELLKLTHYLQKFEDYQVFVVNDLNTKINLKHFNLFISDKFVPKISEKEFKELLNEIIHSEDMKWDMILLGKCTTEDIKRNVQYVNYDYYTYPLLFNKNVKPMFDPEMIQSSIENNKLNVLTLNESIFDVLENTSVKENKSENDKKIIKNSYKELTFLIVFILLIVIIYFLYKKYFM